jgi:DNA-binding transcriptional regulator YhcF (GntR family)
LPDSFQLRGVQAGNWQNGIVAFRLLRHQAPLTLSLAEQLAAQIGDRIVGDLYKPGARVIEQELADEFKVSRGPVRDALRILEREGLVAIHARRGAQVTELSEQEVAEVFEVRAALLRIVSERLAADTRCVRHCCASCQRGSLRIVRPLTLPASSTALPSWNATPPTRTRAPTTPRQPTASA